MKFEIVSHKERPSFRFVRVCDGDRTLCTSPPFATEFECHEWIKAMKKITKHTPIVDTTRPHTDDKL